MAPLTRRRYPDRPDCWHVYYGDVNIGTIARRTGQPHDEDPWEWRCGFYPGSDPGEDSNGTAATFEEARADFEDAWRVFSSHRTEADYQSWRNHRDWTELEIPDARHGHAATDPAYFRPVEMLLRRSDQDRDHGPARFDGTPRIERDVA